MDSCMANDGPDKGKRIVLGNQKEIQEHLEVGRRKTGFASWTYSSGLQNRPHD